MIDTCVPVIIFSVCQGDVGPGGPTGPQGVKGEQGDKGQKVSDEKYTISGLHVVILPFGNVNGVFYCTGQPWFWDPRTTGTKGRKWREGEAPLKPLLSSYHIEA